MKSILLLTTVLLSRGVAVATAAKEPKTVWTFEDQTPGEPADGFHEEVGEWKVADDDGNKVLFQKAKNPDATFNVVLVEGMAAKDLDLSVKLKAVAGNDDRGGGLVWRAIDKDNYYICRYNPLEDNFRVYTVVKGKRTMLKNANIKHTDGWHTVRITMRGDKIECFFDGKKYLEATDTVFPKAGRIGLWSKADAQSYFDDISAVGLAVTQKAGPQPAAPQPATREFEIKADRAFLGRHEVDLWGLRCGNALFSEATTERHVRNLDNMVAHGINTIGFYIQGANAGWPNADAGLNGFTRDGRLKPEVGARIERLVREADRRGMVAMVGLISPRKDQDFYDDAAIRRSIEETGKFLVRKKLKNVFVDLVHEFGNPERIDKELLREPGGAEKKSQLTAWFKAVAPDIEAGICPDIHSETATYYPGMEVRFIQKEMPIPAEGFVVNPETLRQDQFQNDGVFNAANLDYIFADCQRFLDAPNAVMLFHAAYIQGITNFSGTAPHPEMGGYGTGPNDRGVRFYYEWVRDHVGRWEYPKHVPVVASSTP
ncbi:MAG TPA: family 16 glycoside hydrolase [Pirellulales bacterium]|nr:family 16 glycoside hydrolase [Pirellulales bacterium]